MRQLPFLILLIILSGFFTHCKKEPINKTYYQDTLINGNIAPPYNGVNSIQINSYINRLYIDLLGREPLDIEISSAYSILVSGGLTQGTKESFINDLLSSSEYYDRFFDIYSTKMIAGYDSIELNYSYYELKYAIDSLLIPGGDSITTHIALMQLERLENLISAKNDYKIGLISINEFIRRMIINHIYDEINMGTENFVLATFENLYHRFPTDNEKSASENIVDGQPDILFLQTGNSKLDFSNIVTTCDEFYQGIIIDLYNIYLLRNPSTEEILDKLTTFKQSGDISNIQLDLLTIEEYAGF